MIRSILIGFGLFIASSLGAQEVKWMSFEQLDSALLIQPKPVLIKFYTDWCTYCRKMDQEVFIDSGIAQQLNENYYAVSFDAEADTPVSFEGQQFIKKKGERFHSIAMLLASKDGEFNPPALIFLNEKFEIQGRIFEYQSRKKMLRNLEKHH